MFRNFADQPKINRLLIKIDSWYFKWYSNDIHYYVVTVFNLGQGFNI